MKSKKIILLACFILILSVNAISAATDKSTDYSNANLQNMVDNKINNNIIKQESNFVYIDGNSKNDIEDGSSELPYKTLNNQNLEKISSNSTVYVSKGTYEIDPTNFNKNISIIGENKEEVIFIPNESITIFTIDKECNVKLSNFTFSNFSSDSISAIINNGNLNIENLNFVNNGGTIRSSKNGNILNNANLEIINSTFEDNSASFGSAVYNKGNTIIVDSEFKNNQIYNVGGVIYSLRGNLTVFNSNFTGNKAVSGAAIYNAAGYCYVNNSRFIENDAERFYGGGIYSTGITITNNSIFDSNHAHMDGGAITNTNNFTIVNCSFIYNFADDNGGVIENVPWSERENGNLTIINSSFIENAAGGNGGVIMNYGKVESVGETATVTARNCLFEANSASIGGVIYNEQYMDFQYNVFIENDADDGKVIFSDESLIKSIDYNWWGTNNPAVGEIGHMPDSWIVLNFTNTTALNKDFNSTLKISLNTLNNGEMINESIPSRTAIFSADETVFESNNVNLSSEYQTDIMSMGDVITVSVDNQELSLQPGNKINVIVTCDEIADGVYGDNVTVTGRFTDANNRAISNSNVRVFVNGKKYLARTDKNGFYSVAVRVTAVGVNNVSVGYGGSEKYDAYEANATFNAVKQDVIVTCDEITGGVYGDNVTVTGRFTDANNRAISNSNVRVFVNGKKYLARTDKNGFYSVAVRITAVGVNNVSVGYGGSEKYDAYEANATFNAVKQDVIVTYDSIPEVSVGDNLTITGKFMDKNGKAIIKSNVKIIINNKKYFAKTDLNGIYKFSTKITNNNINNVTLGYGGNDKYNEYSTNVVISVKK